MKTKTNSTCVLALTGAAFSLLLARPAAAAPPSIYVTNMTGSPKGGFVGSATAYDTTGAVATGYTATSSAITPYGAAVDPGSNLLYLSDQSSGKISTYNATTGASVNTSFATTASAGLSTPFGMVLAGGNLLVANKGGTTITALNPTTGGAGTGFTSPAGLYSPQVLATQGSILYIGNQGPYSSAQGLMNGFIGAYNLQTGLALPTFTQVTGLNPPFGLAVSGTDLFVDGEQSNVSEYNALTGALINANFITVSSGAEGLAILGNNLLVVTGSTVAEYSIPTVATAGNTGTLINDSFITGLSDGSAITIVPEPSTWAAVLGGAGLLGLTLRRRIRVG